MKMNFIMKLFIEEINYMEILNVKKLFVEERIYVEIFNVEEKIRYIIGDRSDTVSNELNHTQQSLLLGFTGTSFGGTFFIPSRCNAHVCQKQRRDFSNAIVRYFNMNTGASVFSNGVSDGRMRDDTPRTHMFLYDQYKKGDTTGNDSITLSKYGSEFNIAKNNDTTSDYSIILYEYGGKFNIAKNCIGELYADEVASSFCK